MQIIWSRVEHNTLLWCHKTCRDCQQPADMSVKACKPHACGAHCQRCLGAHRACCAGHQGLINHCVQYLRVFRGGPDAEP